MSDFRIDKITNRDGSAGTQIAGITTFSGTSGMQLPVGPTEYRGCLLYTSPSPRDRTRSRMPSSA